MMVKSKINPILTLEYICNENENKFFDRKSSRIKAVDLARHISAFANADGGTIVVGVSDKTHKIEGLHACGDDKVNDFINAPKDCCKPMPRYKEEFLKVTNDEGKSDRILLLHIEASNDQVIRTSDERTYLRIGDKSKEMLGDNLRNLEYAKGSRHFEDEINKQATLEDLDAALLDAYKTRIGASDLDTKQVLSARGFIRKKGKKEYFTNAAVLLFAKNIIKFNMNCRIRFLRIDGREMQVGANYNVVKDKSIDEPILRIIDTAKAFITDQLRVFTRQVHGNGRFVESPEYPEFPWQEGIINAVVHRDYAASGLFIKVSMYDDRLEIESPGCLPDIVTVDNITFTRFSRNSTISRVMTEFEWVRELNEGVKKIYSDMADAGLPKPEYIETPNTVRLILRNNIDERIAHRNKASNDARNDAGNDARNDAEEKILEIIRAMPQVSQEEIAGRTGFSRSKVQRIMKKMIERHVIYHEGARKGGSWREC